MPRRRQPKTDKDAVKQKLSDLTKWAVRQELHNIAAELREITALLSRLL